MDGAFIGALPNGFIKNGVDYIKKPEKRELNIFMSTKD
jgi:hypothetical protein